MKTADQLKPNYGPVYAAAMYPGLAEIFHRHGYALAAHGSLARDFDLVAVPWADKVSDAETVLKEVTTVYAVRTVGEPEAKNHGRIAYTLSCGFGECALDLSFLPNEKAPCAPATDWAVVCDDNMPPLDEIVWLYDGRTSWIWIGGRADDGEGWLWGNTYGSIWHNGVKWDGDLETDDDYKPTHWMRLPEPPLSNPHPMNPFDPRSWC